VAGDGDDDGDGGDVTIDDDDEADEFLTNVSLAIRARRRQRRLDQRSLAARAGVSKSALARIERGDVGACLATLRKVLAEVGLGIVLVDEDGYPWRDGDALPADIEGGLDRAGRDSPRTSPRRRPMGSSRGTSRLPAVLWSPRRRVGATTAGRTMWRPSSQRSGSERMATGGTD
jgi:transcriptional regulator with XRE-family HTH domain